MKTRYQAIAVFLLAAFFLACQDEVPTPQYQVAGTVTISDYELWPTSQTLNFGAFQGQSLQPVVSVQIPQPASGTASFTLANVPAGEYTFKLYIAEQTINKYVLAAYPTQRLESNIELNSQTCTLTTFTRIQGQLLNACFQCHGGSSQAAAGLILSPDKSYEMLVNVPAQNSTKMRVAPFNADQSFIMQILQHDELSFEHSGSNVVKSGDIELVENWINKGALDN